LVRASIVEKEIDGGVSSSPTRIPIRSRFAHQTNQCTKYLELDAFEQRGFGVLVRVAAVCVLLILRVSRRRKQTHVNAYLRWVQFQSETTANQRFHQRRRPPLSHSLITTQELSPSEAPLAPCVLSPSRQLRSGEMRTESVSQRQRRALLPCSTQRCVPKLVDSAQLKPWLNPAWYAPG
jgi:hypothetical protein